MKKSTKILSLLLALVMVCGLFAGCGDTATTTSGTETTGTETAPGAETGSTTPAETGTGSVDTETASNQLPRNETLYIAGYQWGTVNSWNPIGASRNNWGIDANIAGSREIMFESLYMYDFLTGNLIPLLADGDYRWNADRTALSIDIKPAAKWSDGTDLTAYDVVRTFDIGVQTTNYIGGGYASYVDRVEADGDKSLTVYAKLNGEGKAVNPLKLLDFIGIMLVAQVDWIDKLVERNNGETIGILNDRAEDAVYSGPYHPFFDDDQKVAYVRDDNYWGQDESMWGSLPVPKYLCHTIFSDNAAVEVSFKAGQVVALQSFLPNIQDYWLKDGLPISTWYDEAPYGVCLCMPTMFYNMNNAVLADNVALRKAIAIAVDYDAIIANAMTNQSPSFSDVPRSIMNPTDGEQAMYDHDAVKDLQWAGMDIEGAIALLDEAGIVDTDGDGWREDPATGKKISLNVCCPNGWTDWQAAVEIVCAAGAEIGIDLSSYYTEWSIYQTVFTNPSQTEYDLFMYNSDGAGPSNPWARAVCFLGKDYVGIQNNWSGNWGQYVNDEADAIIQQIPQMTDENEIREAYTELTRIYLTEVPSFSLMYRPQNFYAVNETVWTNFPAADDGRGITPNVCIDGYGVAALYELELIG